MRGLMRRVEKLEEEVEREREARVEVRVCWVDREAGTRTDMITGEVETGVVFD
jgi:hypothetical protein